MPALVLFLGLTYVTGLTPFVIPRLDFKFASAVQVLKECIYQVLVLRKVVHFHNLSLLNLPKQTGHSSKVGFCRKITPVMVAVNDERFIDPKHNGLGLEGSPSQLSKVIQYFIDSIFYSAQGMVSRNNPFDVCGQYLLDCFLVMGGVRMKELMNKGKVGV
jgi:hypothetical protein